MNEIHYSLEEKTLDVDDARSGRYTGKFEPRIGAN